MKLKPIKWKPFNRAKDISISDSYIIGCTGPKAIILDKQLNLVHIIDGLEYVYSAQMSPDEKHLLLISNGNKFYIVNMLTFEKTRVTVRAPHNSYLEGKGCWSFDGESILIPVQQYVEYGDSTLRCYSLKDISKYQDFLVNKYHLSEILRLESNGIYLLIGYNRQEDNRKYFIHFDGLTFKEYLLESSEDMVVFSADVDIHRSIVTLYTLKGCYRYTLDGKSVAELSHPVPVDKTYSFYDVFGHLFIDNQEKLEKLKELSISFGSENISTPDFITKYQISSCGNFVYIASESGFYVADAETVEIMASVQEKFGVQNFEEISSDIIALATWSGVSLYQIIN